jgi:hypothetical protein
MDSDSSEEENHHEDGMSPLFSPYPEKVPKVKGQLAKKIESVQLDLRKAKDHQ